MLGRCHICGKPIYGTGDAERKAEGWEHHSCTRSRARSRARYKGGR